MATTVLSCAGVAEAAWQTTGTGTAATQAATLAAPTNVQVKAPTGSSTELDVTWNSPTNPTGATYGVYRDGSATALSCTSSPCQDTTVSAGSTHTYVVKTLLGSWSAAAAGVQGTANAATQTALHIRSLTGTAARQNTNKFHATVNLTVVDANGNPVSGAVVAGTWSPTSATTTSGCTTLADGTCSIASGASDFNNTTAESWTVTGITKSGYSWNSGADVKESVSFNCTSSTCTVS